MTETRRLHLLRSLMKRSFYGSCMGALLCLSCAKNTTPAASGSEGPGEASARERAAAAPLPPLTPVATPEGVVARFRVLDPKKFADGLLDAASIPFDLDKMLNQYEGEYSFLQAMDLSAPIEGALVLNPEDAMNPARFFSVGVRGVDEVLRHLEAERVDVQEGPSGVHHFLLDAQPCAVGRSLGKSPARVVCSDRRGGLHLVLSYALRGFPTEQLSEADVYTHIDFKPVRERYKTELDRLRLLASVFARQAHVGHPKLDRAITDAAIGLADELSRLALEADQVVLEVDEQGGNATLTVRASFDAQASTTVQSVRQQANLSAPAPDLFRALPSTAASGFYYRELGAGSFEAWTSILTDLFSGYAEYRGTSLEFAQRLGRSIVALAPKARTHVHAQGPMVTSTTHGQPTVHPAWTLWGVTQPKTEVLGFLDDLAWMLSSADWIKLVEAPEVGAKLKRTSKSLNGARGAVIYQWSLNDRALAELESELVVPDGMSREEVLRAARQLAHGHLAVFEHAATTYISWSTGDEMTAIQEAVQALNGKGGERLAEVRSLQPMLDQSAVAAGFATLAGMGSELWSLAPPRIVGELTGLLNATPHRAQTPLFVRYNANADKATVAEYTLTVPREFTQDAATLAALVFTEMETE